MLLIPMMLAALAGEPAAQTPGTLFADLSGSCWQGDMGGGVTDTHCFSLSDGGQLGLDVHKVRNADKAVVYEGVTAYHPGAASGKVAFGYYNSLGDLMPGVASRSGDELDITLQIAGKPVDVVWRMTADGYDVTNPMMPATVHFRKVGPVGDGGL